MRPHVLYVKASKGNAWVTEFTVRKEFMIGKELKTLKEKEQAELNTHFKCITQGAVKEQLSWSSLVENSLMLENRSH